MSTYRPRVITVEYNSNYGHGNLSSLATIDTACMPFSDYAFPQEPFSCFYGSSAAAIDAAAQEFHYKLVGSVSKLDLA